MVGGVTVCAKVRFESRIIRASARVSNAHVQIKIKGLLYPILNAFQGFVGCLDVVFVINIEESQSTCKSRKM